MSPRFVLAAFVLAACHASPPPIAPASEHAVACPLGVVGALVRVDDTTDGVDLTLTTSNADRVSELRARTRDVAALHGPGAHAGQGHNGLHLGAQAHGLRLTELPPVTATEEDVDGGARLRLVAKSTEQVSELRWRVHIRAEAVSAGPCD